MFRMLKKLQSFFYDNFYPNDAESSDEESTPGNSSAETDSDQQPENNEFESDEGQSAPKTMTSINVGDKVDLNSKKLAMEDNESDSQDETTETYVYATSTQEPQLYDNNQLRKIEDFKEAYAAREPLILGRDKDKTPYTQKVEYIGRVLNPERRGDDWTCERNAAFWAGGIESGATFKIVTRLNSIVQRAIDGYDNLSYTEGWFGGAAREILWLEDNGYTFRPDLIDQKYTWADPSKERVKNAVLRINYASNDNTDAKDQIARLQALRKNVDRERYAKTTSQLNPNQFFSEGPRKLVPTTSSRASANLDWRRQGDRGDSFRKKN